jgi:hypothetical protein
MDRKVAFSEMRDLVHEQDSLEDLLNALKDYFRVHHTDELESFYQPTQEESMHRKKRKYRRKSTGRSPKHKSTSDVEDSDSDDNENENVNAGASSLRADMRSAQTSNAEENEVDSVLGASEMSE